LIITDIIKMMNVDSCDRKGKFLYQLVITIGWPTDDDIKHAERERYTYYFNVCMIIIIGLSFVNPFSYTNNDLDQSYNIYIYEAFTSRWSLIINGSLITIFRQQTNDLLTMMMKNMWFISFDEYVNALKYF